MSTPPFEALTRFHAKLLAHELSLRKPSDSVEKLATALADAQVNLNPDQVDGALFTFLSEIEREFAKQLDARDDIELFVKLPRWFVVDTPVGEYNPDWAILMDGGQATLYLAKKTKSKMDFTKLRTAEADKVNRGKRHSRPSAYRFWLS